MKKQYDGKKDTIPVVLVSADTLKQSKEKSTDLMKFTPPLWPSWIPYKQAKTDTKKSYYTPNPQSRLPHKNRPRQRNIQSGWREYMPYEWGYNRRGEFYIPNPADEDSADYKSNLPRFLPMDMDWALLVSEDREVWKDHWKKQRVRKPAVWPYNSTDSVIPVVSEPARLARRWNAIVAMRPWLSSLMEELQLPQGAATMALSFLKMPDFEGWGNVFKFGMLPCQFGMVANKLFQTMQIIDTQGGLQLIGSLTKISEDVTQQATKRYKGSDWNAKWQLQRYGKNLVNTNAQFIAKMRRPLQSALLDDSLIQEIADIRINDKTGQRRPSVKFWKRYQKKNQEVIIHDPLSYQAQSYRYPIFVRDKTDFQVYDQIDAESKGGDKKTILGWNDGNLIKFWIENMNDGRILNTPAFISQLTDEGLDGQWDQFAHVGGMYPKFSYKGVNKRVIGFKLQLGCFDKKYISQYIDKLNFLRLVGSPFYKKINIQKSIQIDTGGQSTETNTMQFIYPKAPIYKLTLGDLIYETYGYFQSCTIQWDQQSTVWNLDIRRASKSIGGDNVRCYIDKIRDHVLQKKKQYQFMEIPIFTSFNVKFVCMYGESFSNNDKIYTPRPLSEK